MTTVQARALQVAIAARVPTLLWGPPGTGKSSHVKALAGVLGLPVEVVIASVREPSDFAGLPVVTPAGVRLSPPAWARRLVDAGRGVLFLDEITQAPPATQAALWRVVLERVVGDDLELPEEVAVIAAANPPKASNGGWELSAPLANRFVHLSWSASLDAFATGMISGWPPPDIVHLDPSWREAVAQHRARVVSFLRCRPELLHKEPENEAEAGGPWPSNRSWETAATLLAAAAGAGVDDAVALTLVSGCVGEGTALEFLVWSAELDLPDPEDVLAHPEAFDPPRRGDQARAILDAVASAAVARPDPTRWAAAWTVLGRVAASKPDLAVPAGQILARCRPPGARAPDLPRSFLRVMERAGLQL